MWGIFIGVVVYAAAMIFIIGKEGMREYNSKTVWTKEEIEKVKGASVMGWKLLIVVIVFVGTGLLGYCYVHTMPDRSELLQQTGIVTKITESGDGAIGMKLKGQKEVYVIRSDAKHLVDQKRLKKCKQEKAEIFLLYKQEKGILQKDEILAVYDLKSAQKQILMYKNYKQSYANMNHLWMEMSCMLFTIAFLSVLVLLYAKKNPEVYKIICIMKPEKAIKPTLAQKVSREVDEILTKNLEPENGRIDAGYYGKIQKTFKNIDKEKQDL